MKICSGLLFILFYSQTMLAATYWSHIPGEGVVQISALTETQHQKLATHLSLNAAETAIWINNLPALLNAVS